MLEILGRHCNDREPYIIRSNEKIELELGNDQTAVLGQLLRAQHLERLKLRSQQTREIQQLRKRAEAISQDIDIKTKIEIAENLQAKVQWVDEYTRIAAAMERQAADDCNRFELIDLGWS